MLLIYRCFKSKSISSWVCAKVAATVLFCTLAEPRYALFNCSVSITLWSYRRQASTVTMVMSAADAARTAVRDHALNKKKKCDAPRLGHAVHVKPRPCLLRSFSRTAPYRARPTPYDPLLERGHSRVCFITGVFITLRRLVLAFPPMLSRAGEHVGFLG